MFVPDLGLSDEHQMWEHLSSGYRDTMLTIWAPGIINPLFTWIDQLDDCDFKTCVDFGCGDGALVSWLQTRFPAANVVGIDYAQNMIGAARANHTACHFRQGNMADLLAWHNQVDLATTTNSILSPSPGTVGQMFCEETSTVRPGGVFAGVVPSGDTIDHLINCAIDFKVASALTETGAKRKSTPTIESYMASIG